MIKGKDDITDDEIEEYYVPLNENFRNYMIGYVIPEVFAFEIANAYFRDCLCEATFEQHYKSMCDVFNGFTDSLREVSGKTLELLQVKYNLTIINYFPLVLKKWQ